MILFHNLIHILIVDVNIDNLLSLFKRLVSLIKIKFLAKFLLKRLPMFLLIPFHPKGKIQTSLISLIILGFGPKIMWINIESSQIIAIDGASNRLCSIASPI